MCKPRSVLQVEHHAPDDTSSYSSKASHRISVSAQDFSLEPAPESAVSVSMVPALGSYSSAPFTGKGGSETRLVTPLPWWPVGARPIRLRAPSPIAEELYIPQRITKPVGQTGKTLYPYQHNSASSVDPESDSQSFVERAYALSMANPGPEGYAGHGSQEPPTHVQSIMDTCRTQLLQKIKPEVCKENVSHHGKRSSQPRVKLSQDVLKMPFKKENQRS